MDKLLKAVFQIHEFKFRTDDDFVDRLNRHYTPMILVLFTVLVSVKQYVGDPISCWCPAQFTSSHQEYTNTVCWVSDTYYVPFDKLMPLVHEPRQMISYYQWVPVILLSQACLFFMPCTGWRFLNRRIGLSISALVEAAKSCQKAIYPETKEKTIRYMVLQIDAYLMKQTKMKDGRCSKAKQFLAKYCCFVCSRLYGNYLTCVYFITKVLYVANVISQLFLLDIFLGMGRDYHLYGIHVMARLIGGNDWTLSERFPRVTLCDFQVRQQTNVHRYTVQCVLPINLFNEKIFIFIWFWFLFIFLSTVANLIHWITKTAILSMQVSFVKRQLRAMDFNKREAKTIKKFTECYLRRDGILIVRLIAKNAGELIAAEVLNGLWTNYGPDRRAFGSSSDSRGDRKRQGQGQGHGRPLISQDIV